MPHALDKHFAELQTLYDLNVQLQPSSSILCYEDCPLPPADGVLGPQHRVESTLNDANT